MEQMNMLNVHSITQMRRKITMDAPVSIKERYLSIINNEKHGIFPGSIKTALLFLSFFYRGVLSIRYLMYETGLKNKITLPVPVISVGNITMGGTGKTPIVEYIALYLKNKGKKIAILSRGYGSKKKKRNKH